MVAYCNHLQFNDLVKGLFCIVNWCGGIPQGVKELISLSVLTPSGGGREAHPGVGPALSASRKHLQT